VSKSGDCRMTSVRRTWRRGGGISSTFFETAGALRHLLAVATRRSADVTQTAGVAFNIRVTAQDASNNTVTNFTGAGNTVDVTSKRVGSARLNTSPTNTTCVLASHGDTLTQSGVSSTITPMGTVAVGPGT